MYHGGAKRLNCVLLERTWAFLHSSTLPRFLWEEVVKHTVWLKNRTATCAFLNSQIFYGSMDIFLFSPIKSLYYSFLPTIYLDYI
jgi:hypothetical protein